MSGTSMVSRFIHTRSPRTDFDAQLFVDLAFLKNTGLKNIQAREAAAGIAHHQPIQTLLQKASTIRGSTEYRVHTLHGFACFIQFLSLSRKAEAIFRSTVIWLLPFGGYPAVFIHRKANPVPPVPSEAFHVPRWAPGAFYTVILVALLRNRQSPNATDRVAAIGNFRGRGGGFILATGCEVPKISIDLRRVLGIVLLVTRTLLVKK